MATAIGRARNADSVSVQMEAALVDELPNETPQVRDFGVQVSEVRLAPRLTKSPRRVAKHCYSVTDECVGDITRARFASSPAMHQHDKRKWTTAWRHLERHVEQRAVDVTRKKAVADT